MKFEVHLEGPSGTRQHVVELEREGENFLVVLDGQRVDARRRQGRGQLRVHSVGRAIV